MEVYAWAEDQRDRRRREFFELLQRGRDIWTPRHIFNRCCVKWLIDGRIQHDEYGGFYDSPFDPKKGCNGCSRDHPCITLRFDVTTKSTIAHLSHRLDPFLHYMDGLVEEGTARPQSASEYKIDGYLRPNVTLIRSHDGFGRHLVKVEDSELDASDAAQRAELEEQEARGRAAKRPRKTEEGEEEDLNAEGLAAAAMDAVMKHQFQDDPLTLFCLRQVNKSFKKSAESVASTKVKTLDITVTPLVNGTQRFGSGRLDGYDPETFRDDGFDEYANIAEYTKREKILLDFQHAETGDGGYNPTNTDAATFAWDSGKLDRESDPEDEDWSETAEYSEYAYCGQMFRVYWHPTDSDPVKSPVHSVFYGQQKSFGVLIAEFPLSNRCEAGITNISHSGVTLSFDVLESNVSKTEEEMSGYETDEEAEDGGRRVVKYIQFSGRIKLISVKVDFSVLVGLHASQVRRELLRRYERITKERPLTTTESEYLEFVRVASKQG